MSITMQEYDVALQGLSLSDDEEGAVLPAEDEGIELGEVDGEDIADEPLEEGPEEYGGEGIEE